MFFRDRDAPVTEEGLIFRVYGYTHPPDGCVCDLEYAPEKLYKPDEPKALREGRNGKFFKFYFDGGLKFIEKNFPKYRIYYAPLKKKLVGLKMNQIKELRKPKHKLKEILEKGNGDPLILTLKNLISEIQSLSGLKLRAFGVFGSILHNFHNPLYSDIDLIIYGRRNLHKLRETLKEIYNSQFSNLRNEFEKWNSETPLHHWHFTNLTKKEFWFHQKRKLIYAVYNPKKLGRKVKVEFEPVKEWNEIKNNYLEIKEIKDLGWCKILFEVTDASEAFFMPSIYKIEPVKVLKGEGQEVMQVISFVEEFRGQLKEGEKGVVQGRVEEVVTSERVYKQIALSYGPNYFNQVLKKVTH